MAFQAIALDLDGTLLDSRRAIRPASLAALVEAQRRGMKVLVATGRHHEATRAYQHQLALTTPAICCNGAYLYDFQGETLLPAAALHPEDVAELLRLARTAGLAAKLYTSEAMTYEVLDAHIGKFIAWGESLPEPLRPRIDRVEKYETLLAEKPNIWRFALFSESDTTLRAFAQALRDMPRVQGEFSEQNLLDITPAGYCKGKRLTEWAAGAGIPMENVIAFGNYHNDVSMIRAAGLGVAMGNSEPDVKASADLVAPGGNDSDAIAEIVLHHLPN